MNISTENFIGIYEDAFSKEYCDSLISHFEQLSAVGLTTNRQASEDNINKLYKDDEQLPLQESARLPYSGSSIREFNSVFWDKIYTHYSTTFGTLRDFDKHSLYYFKIQKTHIGGGYHVWHAETCSRDLCTRILAWTLYLNDVEEGGETEFLYYPKRVKPKAGTLVLWPAGFTHTHRGNPPISNTKYIATGWIEF